MNQRRCVRYKKLSKNNDNANIIFVITVILADHLDAKGMLHTLILFLICEKQRYFGLCDNQLYIGRPTLKNQFINKVRSS